MPFRPSVRAAGFGAGFPGVLGTGPLVGEARSQGSVTRRAVDVALDGGLLGGAFIRAGSILPRRFVPDGAVSDEQEWPGIIMAGCDVSPPRNRSWISRMLRAVARSVRVSLAGAPRRFGNSR